MLALLSLEYEGKLYPLNMPVKSVLFCIACLQSLKNLYLREMVGELSALPKDRLLSRAQSCNTPHIAVTTRARIDTPFGGRLPGYKFMVLSHFQAHFSVTVSQLSTSPNPIQYLPPSIQYLPPSIQYLPPSIFPRCIPIFSFPSLSSSRGYSAAPLLPHPPQPPPSVLQPKHHPPAQPPSGPNPS